MHALEDDGSDLIRVLLVEDHTLFRQALSLLLYRRQQMEVVEAGTLLDVAVLDHLIIGSGQPGFVSLKERGLGFGRDGHGR